MKHSEQIDAIAAALVKAQAEVRAAKQSGKNPHFRSVYSTLDDIMDAVRPALQGNALAIIQHPQPSDSGTLALETMVLHDSGQWMSETLTMPLPKSDPQGYGSALTYARRYALGSLMGVSTSEDDDGNAATPQRNGNQRKPVSKPKAEPDTVDESTLQSLHIAGKNFYGNKKWEEKRPELVESVTGGRTKSSKELTTEEAVKLIRGINKKADEAQEE